VAITKPKQSIIIAGVLAFFGMLALYTFWNPVELAVFPKCPFYAATGIYCPGCGSQRAVHQMLNGNIVEGIRYNYLIALLAVVLLYEAFMYIMNVFLRKDFPNLLHKSKVTHGILVIVLLFWLLRNINVFPFTELAP